MRTQKPLIATVVFFLLVSLPLASAIPPSGGDTNTITASETWTDDASMDGHVVVANGATLTVNANITMAKDATITVEEGAQLVVTNGALVSEDLNAGVMVNGIGATLKLNFGDLADNGVVQIMFDHTIGDAKFNVSLGNETINASGTNIVQFDAPLNGTELVVMFDSLYFQPTYVLWAKAIYGGGNTETLLAEDLTAVNAPLYWFQSGFEIHAHGGLTVTSSEIMGADIHCKALCRFDSAHLIGSAPVDAATTSSVVVLDSILTGSRTDEDIVLHDDASITYTNSQGTGGSTDAWIRLLSTRSLSTNVPSGSLDIAGMGWGGASWNDLTDNDGNIVLVENSPTSEHRRIVEWMDGNGVVHEEDATITLSTSSSWGTYATTIDAPKSTSATLQLDLPYVDVTGIMLETTTGEVNRGVSGMITVENSGTADVTGVNIWCYELDGAEPAREDLYNYVVETTQVVVSLAAGESKDVPFTFYRYSPGQQSVTCIPLLPSQLEPVDDDVYDSKGATSVPVLWEAVEEEATAPILIWVVVAVGFVIIILLAVSRARFEAMADSEEDEEDKRYEFSDEVDSEMEEELAVEAENSEEATDSDTAGDDEEPKSTDSIYDFEEEAES